MEQLLLVVAGEGGKPRRRRRGGGVGVHVVDVVAGERGEAVYLCIYGERDEAGMGIWRRESRGHGRPQLLKSSMTETRTGWMHRLAWARSTAPAMVEVLL
jgi:hypothetical protein